MELDKSFHRERSMRWLGSKQKGKDGNYILQTLEQSILSVLYDFLLKHQGSVYSVSLSQTYSYANSTDTQPRTSTAEMAKRLTLQSSK